jgi:ribosomal protein L7/L12
MESFLINLMVGGVFAFLFVLVLLSVLRRRSRRGNMLERELTISGATPTLAPPAPAPKGSMLAIGREITPEVERLIRDGNKIAAIALVRERSGLGLKESKEAVEMMERVLKFVS